MDRWWAPQRPTTEPDAVVLAMLEPGDLGSALLAAHRAGAAAMETVSKGALPSEQALVAAMVTARANVAEKVVDSVAKSGTTPTYAALLVRDVLDEAEQAALTVYRTAVNKGIAPPVAAGRAAAVYGVPPRELGKYLSVAADPKSNPVAVTDAADRALMGYISKLVTEEGTSGQQVEFAKAPTAPGPPEPRHHHLEPTVSAGWEEREHPRGPEGKFARKPQSGTPRVAYQDPTEPQTQTGGGAPPRAGSLAWLRQQLAMSELPQAPAKVADIVEEKAPPKPTPPKKMKTMPTMRRVPKLQHTGGATRQGEAVRQGQVVRSGNAQRAVQQATRLTELSTLTQAVNQEASGVDQSPYAPEPSGPTRTSTLPDYLIPRYNLEHSDELDPSFSFAVGRRDANEFMTRLAEQAGGRGRRVFRIGYLMDIAGNPEKSTSKEARNNLAWQAKLITGEDTDYQQFHAPDVDFLHPQDMARDPEHTENFIRRRVHEKATKQIQGADFILNQPDTDLLARTHSYPVWKPLGIEEESELYPEELSEEETADVAVVQFDDGAPIPIIDEFIIDWGALGHVHGEGRHKEYTINPHQAFEVINPPGSKRGEKLHAQELWDGKNGVLVNRWYLKAVDDEDITRLWGPGKFGKAQDFAEPPKPFRQPNTAFEQLHPRDEHGRFADAATRSSLPSPSSMREPQQLSQALQDQLREVLQQPATQAAIPPVVRQPKKMKTMRRVKQLHQTQPVARQGAAVRQGNATRQAIQQAVARSTMERQRERYARLEEADEVLPQVPVLDDRGRYIALTSFQLANLMRNLGSDGTKAVTITDSHWHRLLAETEPHDGTGVMAELNMNTNDEVVDNEGEAQQGYVWKRRTVGRGPWTNGSEKEITRLGNDIAHAFHTDKNIAQIHVDYRDDYYVLYANKDPVKPQALLELSDDIDWSKPLELIPLGEYRATEMMARRTDLPGAPLTPAMDLPDTYLHPTNASVRSFLLQNSRVNRYRVQNTDDRDDPNMPLFRV